MLLYKSSYSILFFCLVKITQEHNENFILIYIRASESGPYKSLGVNKILTELIESLDDVD